MKTYLILNPNAQAGGAERLYQKLRSRISVDESYSVRRPEDWESLSSWIETRMASPARWLIAGGDGTVHSVLNLLCSEAEKRNLRDDHWKLGLVALGSSNDYHKRVSHQVVDRLRADFDRAFPQELLEIEIQRGPSVQKRYSFLNVGIGITAQGNWTFNHSKTARWLKSRSVNAAIQFSALKAFLSRKPVDALISLDHSLNSKIRFANLSIFMNPHFSGSFRYPISAPLPSGRFGVAWVNEAHLSRLVPIFIDLMRGKFRSSGIGHLDLHHAIRIDFSTPTPVEIDGELWQADSVRIRIASRKVYVCP